MSRRVSILFFQQKVLKRWKARHREWKHSARERFKIAGLGAWRGGTWGATEGPSVLFYGTCDASQGRGVSVVQRLARSPYTRKVPGSKPGGNTSSRRLLLSHRSPSGFAALSKVPDSNVSSEHPCSYRRPFTILTLFQHFLTFLWFQQLYNVSVIMFSPSAILRKKAFSFCEVRG